MEAIVGLSKHSDLLDFPPIPVWLPHKLAVQAEPAPASFNDRGIFAIELRPT